MDVDQRQATKQHYDLHAAAQLPTAQALRARREGPAAPLKSFHNEIKRRLIYRFAYEAPAVLDYACGRGGDLQKWRSAKVQYVKGLDLSPQEIAEAQRRYEELQHKFGAQTLRAEFQQIDTLGVAVHDAGRQFDAATCMFALHYFFDREESLSTLMTTVANNLKPGGYFIGVVPDGRRIKAHLKAEKGLLSKPHLLLKQVSEDTKAAYGAAYIMEIPDTVVEGHQGVTEGSHEYLVFEKVLLAQAKKYGLHPVTDYGDPALNALFDETDRDKPLKHFNPQYPPGTDDSLSLASKLYMAFVLQKVESPEQVRTPPLPPPEARDGGRQQQQRQQQQSLKRARSPTREERYAAEANQQAPAAGGRGGWQQPQQQRQQQPRSGGWAGGGGRGGGGGGRNRLNSLDWQLPYPPTILPDLPSVYNNMRPDKLKARGQQLGRFVLLLPQLPGYAGPVQYYSPEPHNRNAPLLPIYQRLPDGREIHSYYDELNHHAALDARTAAAAAMHAPPPLDQQQPPGQQHQQQQQQQQHSRPGGNHHQQLPPDLPPPPPPVTELSNTPTPPPPDAALMAAAAAGAGGGGGSEQPPAAKKQAAAPPPPAAAAPKQLKMAYKPGQQSDPLGYKGSGPPAPLPPELVASLMAAALTYADS